MIRKAIAGLALMLTSLPAFAQEWSEIDCAESRLVVDFERPHCATLLKERRGSSGALVDYYSAYGWWNGNYRQLMLTAPRFHNYVDPDIDSGKPLKAWLQQRFKWLRQANNWSAEQTSAGTLYVVFDDADYRPCMGFQAYRGLKNKGYRYGLFGFFCQEAGKKPNAEDLAQFLDGIGID